MPKVWCVSSALYYLSSDNFKITAYFKSSWSLEQMAKLPIVLLRCNLLQDKGGQNAGDLER